MASAETLVSDLSNPDLREKALHELSKRRESFQELASLLWGSFGTIAALLQEIISVYPFLSPPTLSLAQSNRVCNALTLLQCVASHLGTKNLFVNAHIPLYLYPFLTTTSKSRQFESLRLTSLGVIGALVKVDDTRVTNFLLTSEIIPLSLRTMEMGSELSKTVATFIVQKILLGDTGLNYICTNAERFFALVRVLNKMIAALPEQPSLRLFKHIVRCYLRLTDNPRACEALGKYLPDTLRDATFSSFLREDPTARRWIQLLIHNISRGNRIAALEAGGAFERAMVQGNPPDPIPRPAWPLPLPPTPTPALAPPTTPTSILAPMPPLLASTPPLIPPPTPPPKPKSSFSSPREDDEEPSSSRPTVGYLPPPRAEHASTPTMINAKK